MAESFFLTKTTLDPQRLIEIGGVAALDQYEALRGFLMARVGRDAADLFAEPLLSRGNGAAPTAASWYAHGGGQVARLSDLPPDARGDAEAVLKRLLAQIADALADPDFGLLLGAAMLLDGPDDVWVVDGKPVLVNWGVAPPEAQGMLAARDSHFAATLGRFLPLAAAPALSREEWAARGYGTGRPTAAGAAAASAAAPIAADGPDEPADAPRATAGAGSGGKAQPAGAVPVGAATAAASLTETPEPRAWRWRWVAPVALVVLFGALLVWLLMPGSLLYPPRQAGSILDEDSVLDAARAGNRTLEDRIAELRGALDGAVCTPGGELVLPGGLTPDGRTPHSPDAASLPPPGTPSPARPEALAPPPPSRLVRPGLDGGDPVSLLATLERGVAMVLARGSESGGHGTGFFITPDTLVTNHHVIAHALEGGEVFVTSEALGAVRPARILAALGPMETTGGDFAILRLDAPAGEPLRVRAPQEPIKLQQVVAAGYPGFALADDLGFQALMDGDGAAAPGLVVTDGIVNAEQQIGPRTAVVMHTAHVSPGNSGGPLVDACGQVVGVNTFIRVDESTLSSLNFALASEDLIAFLRANGAEAALAEDGCQPALAAPSQAPAPAPGPGPATPPAPQ